MDLLNLDFPVRVIESEQDHERALRQMAELMDLGPAEDPDGVRLLKTLAVLVRDYESRNHQIAPPDPVDAIAFRMEQQGLSPKDLVPYLGTRSRVSEILARKRPLTVSMIRSLHRGLGIPAESLLGERAQPKEQLEIDWRNIPFGEMKTRGWIDRLPRSSADAMQTLMQWLGPVNMAELAPLFRRHVRSAKSVDHERLVVWTAQVARRALEHAPAKNFTRDLSDDFLRDVARISVFRDGPSLVQEFLSQHGIALVVEKALSPWLDGAAMFHRGVPVVALTLRHDRLDNFWFVLMHELVHLLRHLGPEASSFYDDLDSDDQADPREVEADLVAGEILVPSDEWRTSPASRLKNAEAATQLAQRLRVHPAIVAGRIRKTYKDYRVLSGLIGQGEVRRQFPEYGV